MIFLAKYCINALFAVLIACVHTIHIIKISQSEIYIHIMCRSESLILHGPCSILLDMTDSLWSLPAGGTRL